MAPIYESDLGEKRWDEKTWESYELWEKIEAKNRKRRRQWIYFSILVFLIFSSIPVVIALSPKWKTLRIVRKVAQELTHMKSLAALSRKPHRLVFLSEDANLFRVEKVTHCSDQIADAVVQEFALRESGVRVLSENDGNQFQMNGITRSVCYDPVQGIHAIDSSGKATALLAMGFLESDDFQRQSLESLSSILIRTGDGTLTFE